jgi:uncharacterized membrane protein
MTRLLEILLGLDRGFLAREGDLSLSFSPAWPGQDVVGAATWNFFLVVATLVLVVFLFRREGKTSRVRLALASMRFVLLLLVITLLNRPNLTLTQSRTEPSVLAVMIDDSISMRVGDVALASSATTQPGTSRLDGARSLLTGSNNKLLADLAAVHRLRFYRFSNDAQPIVAESIDASALPSVGVALQSLKPEGGQTRLVDALRTVASDLQGQRLAGALVLSDGRQTDATAVDASSLKDQGIKVYAVPIGGSEAPRNIEIDTVQALDAVFVGDIANFRVNLRAAGVPVGATLTLRLKDVAGNPVLERGKPVEQVVTWLGEPQQLVEFSYVPDAVGILDLVITVDGIGNEIDDADNSRQIQLAVLDANIRVLYVEGYPRWEYRYLRQELIRDKTIECSLLLTSADTKFYQEGDKPITRFPETLEEILAYDVVLIGDVDPRQFTDDQLQLINEFVSRRGGGLGMVAGPLYAPSSYKGTAIEPLLPVDISRTEAERFGGSGTLAQGWRPLVTAEGHEGSIFRVYRDAKVNEQFLTSGIQPLFWYARGITAKPGVGTVLAQHPTDTGPDGRPAPLVVLGRFGTGRTLFSGIDDTWRWRYYTGEQVFSSYWVQSLRTLARGKKLGQRKLTLLPEKPVYSIGDTGRLSVRVLDPGLLTQLPDELSVQLVDDAGQPLRDVPLLRRAGSDAYTGSFAADRVGRFQLRLPSVAAGTDAIATPVEVAVPKLELADPKVDRVLLESLSRETGGASVSYERAGNELARLIPSAERSVPIVSDQTLWDSPLAIVLFVSLITTEWVIRKIVGLV